jgi:DNA invertase Pin-like site-specific DNA recombinase
VSPSWVWRLDRLGRSLKHLLETVNQLEQRGVAFVSLTENIDTIWCDADGVPS